MHEHAVLADEVRAEVGDDQVVHLGLAGWFGGLDGDWAIDAFLMGTSALPAPGITQGMLAGS